MLRWKSSFHDHVLRLMLVVALSSCGAQSLFALEEISFGQGTLSARIEPQDLDREAAIENILNESLRSTTGWRRQGSGASEKMQTPSAKRVSSQRTTTRSSSRASVSKQAPTRQWRSRDAASASQKQRADWLPPAIPRDEITPTVPEKSTSSSAKTQTNSSRPSVSSKPLPPKATTKTSSKPLAKSQPQTEKPTDVASRTTRSSASPQLPKGESPESIDRPVVPKKNLKPLTRQQINLRNKVRRVLAHYYNRPLDTKTRGPWELMHAMLSFEVHSRVLQNGPNGEPITAVGWLCFNQPCRKRTLMYLNQDGDLRVRVGPALQGHQGQLLALLAQSRVKSNYPMKVEDKDLTIEDLIEVEKLTCYPRTELTFKLIGLMHYLPSDATWQNDQGYDWNFPRLIQEEMRQPIRGAACGGTHRLSGLTLAVKKRQQRGEPVDGMYAQADRFINKYQNYAYRLQNGDGSFSTEWFRGPGDEADIDRRLKTTGHILEWLLYAANEKELTYWRTVKAVNYLANIMNANRNRDWEAGPLGHAIHALVLYDRYVFAPHDSEEQEPSSTIARGLRSPAR
ncbi:MAG: hypothetical protein RH917_01340 [Lacipirellulaceae bacterium]